MSTRFSLPPDARARMEMLSIATGPSAEAPREEAESQPQQGAGIATERPADRRQ
jgi:hypothetical protein